MAYKANSIDIDDNNFKHIYMCIYDSTIVPYFIGTQIHLKNN